MKNTFIVIAIIIIAFLGGRFTKRCDPVEIVRYDTLPPVIRIDTIRDTLIVPKYVEAVRVDTLRDTIDGKPIYVPVPISNYLFTDDSTYKFEVEGYSVLARSIEVYPRTVTKTIIDRVSVPEKPKRWGIGPQIGFGYNGRDWMPYVGVGIQYQIFSF